MAVLKDSDANTVDVTEGVLAVVEDIENSVQLPSDVEILVLENNGPEIRESLDNLLREGFLGFLFAVAGFARIQSIESQRRFRLNFCKFSYNFLVT